MQLEATQSAVADMGRGVVRKRTAHAPRPAEVHTVHMVNTSQYPAKVLQVLVRFSRDGRETGRVALNVKNSRRGWAGRAYESVPYISARRNSGCNRLVVARIGPPSSFPVKEHHYPRLSTAPVYDLDDWMEALVHLLAHEFAHCEQFTLGQKRSEIAAERSALRTLEKFRLARAELGVDALMTATSDTTVSSSEGMSVRKRQDASSERAAARLRHTEELLAKWERKCNLATTKIKKLTSKLNRMKAAAVRQHAQGGGAKEDQGAPSVAQAA